MQALLQAIATVQARIQAHGSIYANSELQTRYGLIDPILRALDWEISNPDEVRVDHYVNTSSNTRVSGRADYVLMCHNKPRVVIEAKARGQLNSGTAAQGAAYCSALGALLLVCTDGENWEIYDLSKPWANALTSQFSFSKDSVYAIAQNLIILYKSVIYAGLAQPPTIFATATHSSPASTVNNPVGISTTVNALPPHAIPLSSLPQLISQNKSFRPSAIYFPPNYSPVAIRYFNDIPKEVVLFLSGQSLIPPAGVPPIVLPLGSTVINQKRYKQLGAWLTCTHGSAPQVVQMAIRILKRCNINPASVYVS